MTPLKDAQINPLKPTPPQTHKSKASIAVVRRPIATNSRIKNNESLRRDMYLAFVNNALQEHAQGKSGPFNELVNQFSLKQSNPESPQTQQPGQIRSWILALSHVVSGLERRHSVLVEAIVNMPWTTLDSATVKSYTVFLEYLSLVLSKTVQGFTHQSGIQALEANIPEGSSKPLTRRLIYDRLHYLLSHILSLIPTLPSTLQPILVRYFPHKRQNEMAQTTYIRNMLRISTYCPALADKILATIIDRAIQIDVEIQVEIEELDDEDTADNDVFEFDPFDVVVGQEGDEFNSGDESEVEDDDEDAGGDDFSDISSDGGELDEERADVPTNVKHVQEMVKKLDAILTLMFEHFNRSLSPSLSSSSSDSRLSSPLLTRLSPALSTTTIPSTPLIETPPQASRSEILHTTFHSLLAIFDRTILNTFKSRYTQFLIFWYTSLDPEFSDIFQGMLVDRALFSASTPGPALNGAGPGSATNGNAPPGHSSTAELTRAAAASYIGSFVSRATFVDRDGTRRVVALLCEYLNAHLEHVDDAIRENGGGSEWLASTTPAQHMVFYAVAQAVFLIFCFRWRDLQDEVEVEHEEDGLGKGVKDKWMSNLRVLKRVVLSVLNPLKICSPGVVAQFAKVAHQTDFMYCYSVLESNKRGSDYINHGTSPTRHRSGSTASAAPTANPAFLRGSLNDELNTFFPFDPYRLPKSNVFIQAVYREWSSVAIDDDEDDSDDEEEEDAEEDSSDDEKEEASGDDSEGSSKTSRFLAIPGSKKQDVDDGGLGESLIAMSISPRMGESVKMGSIPPSSSPFPLS
ncbi:ribosomal DNA transcription factor Rrn3 [Coprinopsis sp. MPI-PUGE-AT-0042]|nr:ribosomal DNA transcription factor Rrn3 [Coprinopsis sp. MPI-PUGE-AT-0042]